MTSEDVKIAMKRKNEDTESSSPAKKPKNRPKPLLHPGKDLRAFSMGFMVDGTYTKEISDVMSGFRTWFKPNNTYVYHDERTGRFLIKTKNDNNATRFVRNWVVKFAKHIGCEPESIKRVTDYMDVSEATHRDVPDSDQVQADVTSDVEDKAMGISQEPLDTSATTGGDVNQEVDESSDMSDVDKPTVDATPTPSTNASTGQNVNQEGDEVSFMDDSASTLDTNASAGQHMNQDSDESADMGDVDDNPTVGAAPTPDTSATTGQNVNQDITAPTTTTTNMGITIKNITLTPAKKVLLDKILHRTMQSEDFKEEEVLAVIAIICHLKGNKHSLIALTPNLLKLVRDSNVKRKNCLIISDFFHVGERKKVVEVSVKASELYGKQSYMVDGINLPIINVIEPGLNADLHIPLMKVRNFTDILQQMSTRRSKIMRRVLIEAFLEVAEPQPSTSNDMDMDMDDPIDESDDPVEQMMIEQKKIMKVQRRLEKELDITDHRMEQLYQAYRKAKEGRKREEALKAASLAAYDLKASQTNHRTIPIADENFDEFMTAIFRPKATPNFSRKSSGRKKHVLSTLKKANEKSDIIVDLVVKGLKDMEYILEDMKKAGQCKTVMKTIAGGGVCGHQLYATDGELLADIALTKFDYDEIRMPEFLREVLPEDNNTKVVIYKGDKPKPADEAKKCVEAGDLSGAKSYLLALPAPAPAPTPAPAPAPAPVDPRNYDQRYQYNQMKRSVPGCRVVAMEAVTQY